MTPVINAVFFDMRESSGAPGRHEELFEHLVHFGQLIPGLQTARVGQQPETRCSEQFGLRTDRRRGSAKGAAVGLQTQHRYGNATLLDSDFVLGIGNRWANRHTGSTSIYTRGRKFVHIDIEPMQIGRVFCPDLGIVSDAKYALEAFIEEVRAGALDGKFRRKAWVAKGAERKRTSK